MKKLIPILFVLFFALTTHAAWSLPTAPPPAGNPDSPVNTGSIAQTKTGDLTVVTQFTTNDIWTNLFRLATDAGTGKVLVSDALGNASWTATSTLGFGGTSGTNYWTASGNDISNNNAGNVGIGTANPGSLLSLGTGFGQKLGIYEAVNDFYGLGAISSGSGALTLYAGAPNDASKLTVGSNGNVGIGTASPGYLLSLGSGSGNKLAVYESGGAFYGLGIGNGTLTLSAETAGVVLDYRGAIRLPKLSTPPFDCDFNMEGYMYYLTNANNNNLQRVPYICIWNPVTQSHQWSRMVNI